MDSHRKKLLATFTLLVLAISIPITTYLLQQKQDNRSKASAATTLSFDPPSITKLIGDDIALDVLINPGTNSVSYVKFEAKYDPTVLELSPTTPFIANTVAFPTQVQSAVISTASGSLKVALSIGPNMTNAIQTPTKVGTLHFKAINPTSTTSANVTFGDITQVLSIGPSDNPTENVLSTTIPATILVSDPSTPTPTASAISPTPTASESADPTATPSVALTPTILASDSPTPTLFPPTLNPTPTATPSGIQFNLNLILHAIGMGGDNVNPAGNSFSNKNPQHATRSANISLYDTSNHLIGSASSLIHYSSPSGSFLGAITVPTSLTSGFYTVKIWTANHLSRRLPGIFSFANKTVTLPVFQYIAGDASNDNTLNIIDYNLFIDCFDGANSDVPCDDDKKAATDFNDDGLVNQNDYNLFLRELSQVEGD